MPPQEREALVARLTLNRYTDKTIKTGKQLLRITAEANRGWHINLAEHQADTLSVAAPLVLYGSPLALVVGAPLDRAQAKADRIGQALLAASRQRPARSTVDRRARHAACRRRLARTLPPAFRPPGHSALAGLFARALPTGLRLARPIAQSSFKNINFCS